MHGLVGSPRDLVRAGLSPSLVDRFVRTRSRLDPDRMWKTLQGRGIYVTALLDEDYPVRLKEVEHPPPAIFLRGEISARDEWAVAVVGTRREPHMDAR